LTSVHVIPLPGQPDGQVQFRLPAVFVQVARTLQPPLLVAHSLMSLQLKLPGEFAQVKPAPQPPPLVAHSLTSVQVMPLPV
jgi:hypothetical protein